MTTVIREQLDNGKYRYTVNGEVMIKESKVFCEQAQVHSNFGDTTKEEIVTFGKTKGGGNRYLKPFWIKSVEVKAAH